MEFGGGPHGGRPVPPPGFFGGRPGAFYGAKFVKPAATGSGFNDGTNFIDRIINSISDIKITMDDAKRVYGKRLENGKYKATLKSRLFGVRLLTAGRYHETLFNSRVSAAEELFKDRRISERRCKIRKVRAAKKYCAYLEKIGYYSKEQASNLLQYYASQFGVEYIEDTTVEQDAPTRGSL